MLLSAKLYFLSFLTFPSKPVIDITSIKTRLFASCMKLKLKEEKNVGKVKIGQLQ